MGLFAIYSSTPNSGHVNVPRYLQRNLFSNILKQILLLVVLNTRSVKTMPMGKDTVIVDVGNAAEAVNVDEEAANPLHEIQSLCMRCGKNVRLVGKPPMLFLDWFDMKMFDYFQSSNN